MRRVGFSCVLIAMSFHFSVAQADVHKSNAAMEKRTNVLSRSVAPEQAATKPSLLSRLKELFPFGIEFFGWGSGSQKPSEDIAKANCFRSGAAERCLGFRTLEEYVAAAHASRNLGIPFDKLKAKIAGGKTLAQAIRELRPGADYSAAAKQAEQQARKDLQAMSS